MQFDLQNTQPDNVPIISTDTAPVVASAISVLASTIAVLSSLATKNYKQPLAKMALFLLIGDIVFFVPKVIVGFKYPKNELFCQIIVGIVEFGGNSSFFWAPAFAHAFYIVVKCADSQAVIKYMNCYYLFAIYLQIPYGIAAAVMPEYVTYDTNKKECVHTPPPEGNFDTEYFFFAVVPLILVVIPCFIWYAMGIRRIKSYLNQIECKDLSAVVLYPGILLICWLPILISVILRYFNIKVNETIMLGFQALANSQGLFDSIVYGSTSKALKKLGKEGLCCLFKTNMELQPKRKNHHRSDTGDKKIKRNRKMFEKQPVTISMRGENLQTTILGSNDYDSL